MYNWAINYLEENGFEHYEIANFARPYKRSMHNQIYWQNKPYLGIGAGAYSFIRGYRYMNYENPARYIKEIMSGKLPVDLGLLKKGDCKIKLTNKGIFLANTVFREFVD
jgi:oxygen-independent coproporphyrinogen-3 oxidase